jgi:transcriptional regulator with XRE-family HTH domain
LRGGVFVSEATFPGLEPFLIRKQFFLCGEKIDKIRNIRHIRRIMKIQVQTSDAEVLEVLGERLLRTRLERDMTQAQLAELAGVGKRTIERLEAGSVGTQLSVFIRVCRVLGLLERLEVFIPEPVPSPIQQLKLHGKRRKRASGKRKDYEKPVGGGELRVAEPPGPARKWRWGDER